MKKLLFLIIFSTIGKVHAQCTTYNAPEMIHDQSHEFLGVPSKVGLSDNNIMFYFDKVILSGIETSCVKFQAAAEYSCSWNCSTCTGGGYLLAAGSPFFKTALIAQVLGKSISGKIASRCPGTQPIPAIKTHGGSNAIIIK